MADKNIFKNDLIHRESSWTFVETVDGGRTLVEFKDGSTVKHAAKQPSIIDAYMMVRRDYLDGASPLCLSTTTERDALSNTERGTIIDNITNGRDEEYDGSNWNSVVGELGAELHLTAGTVQTTDATQTTVLSLPLVVSKSYMVTAEIIGEIGDYTTVAGFEIKCTAKRESTGGAVLVDSVTTVHSGKDSGASAWLATFTVSGNDLRVSITGQASTTIEWEADLHYLEY